MKKKQTVHKLQADVKFNKKKYSEHLILLVVKP